MELPVQSAVNTCEAVVGCKYNTVQGIDSSGKFTNTRSCTRPPAADGPDGLVDPELDEGGVAAPPYTRTRVTLGSEGDERSRSASTLPSPGRDRIISVVEP